MKNLIKQHHKYIFLAIFFILLVETFLETLSVGIFIPLLNAIFQKNDSSILNYFFNNFNYGISNQIVFFSLLILIFFILKNVLSVLFVYIKLKINFNLKQYYKNLLIEYYLNLNFGDVLKKEKSEIIRNIYSEIDNFVSNFLFSIIEFAKTIFITISIIALLLYYNFKPTFFLLCLLSLIIFIFYHFTKKKLFDLSEKRAELAKSNLGKLTTVVNGLSEIQLYGIQNNFKKYIMHSISAFDNLIIPRGIIGSLPKPFLEVLTISIFSIALILTINMNLEISFNEIITIFSIYLLAALRLMPFINGLGSLYNKITLGHASFKILETEFGKIKSNQKTNAENPSSKDYEIRKIELKNISFRYSKYDKFLFKNLNLEINDKEKIGIYAESGIGKTTLINIIVGLLDPSTGERLVNEKKLSSSDYFNLIKNKAVYLTQDPYFVYDTVTDNIFKYNPNKEISNNQLTNLLQKLELNSFLDEKGNIIKDFIGENGKNLSGGQKQRLSIARALCKDAEIILLDEITSQIDTVNEKKIIDTIYELFKNKTIIMISHNKKNLYGCNSIIKIENNNVIKEKV